MSEPRLYLYRKAGREVWDAEMWLPDGRRRVWRTGIVDKVAAMAAAQVRLEALAAVQAVVPVDGECLADECSPVVSPEPIAEVSATLASEEQAQTLQTPENAKKMGALGRFDGWFFGDLASLWRTRA